MNGICYATLAANSSAFEKNAEELLSPLSYENENRFFKKNRFYNYAMGQAGFSLHMNSSEDSVNIILGSPGVCNSNGDAILTTARENGKFSGTKILAVAEDKNLYDDYYFGKSTFLIVNPKCKSVCHLSSIMSLFEFCSYANRKFRVALQKK